MRYTHLRQADLNLLQILHVLLEERNVTRAAELCFLSQPAMSRALGRLRDMFRDELLVRHGRGYERTARGERLLRDLETLLPRVEGLLHDEVFDPARSTDRFRIAMTDFASSVLLPPLATRLSKLAPSCRLEIVAWHDRGFEDVESGRLDLILNVAGVPSPLESEVLFEEEFVCLVASGHPLRRRRLTLAQYLNFPHAIVNVLGGLQTLVDRPLSDLGKQRRAGLVVPYFVPAVLAISRTNMIVTVPRRLAATVTGIADVREVGAPAEIEGFRYVMAWHPRLTADPAQRWLREQVKLAASAI